MRFSAVQEDRYNVDLGQETPPNDVDESMMAATADDEAGGGGAVGEGQSMISNLPLLFANGYPTSLEKITLPELERFVTFMVQCSSGHETSEMIMEPRWWPKEIKFTIPIVRPKKIYDGYMDNLKKLVFRCYTYHRSEYLLRFCSYLAQYPHEKLEYINNWDSTTSLYLKTTGKLLVTFRNENMNYDKKVESPRKKLLAAKKSKENPSLTKNLRRRSQRQAPSPAMVEPPSDDIYLCETCDAELIGYHRMKEHEKLCYPVEPRPPTPIDIEEKPELTQGEFMEYFKMKSMNTSDSQTKQTCVNDTDDTNATYKQLDSTQSRTSSRIRGSINLTRCPAIPFSSPLGLSLGKKSKMMTEVIQQERLDRIERHLHAPALSTSLKPKWITKIYEFDRWSITYKPNRDKTSQPREYVHQYNFGKYNDKPMLDLRSQLIYLSCKPIYVAVERLSDEQLEELKRDPSSYKCPEPQIKIHRPRSPSVESIYEDEEQINDSSSGIEIIDLDDDEPIPTILPRPQQPQVMPRQLPIVNLPILTIRPQAVVAPQVRPVSPILTRHSPIKSTVRNHMKRPHCDKPRNNSKSIVFVDLCSSDDEDDDEEEMTTDDNSYPMDYDSILPINPMSQPSLQSLSNYNMYISQNRYNNALLYPADSTTTWLSDQHTNGYLDHSEISYEDTS